MDASLYSRSVADKPPLRVGLLLDGLTLQRWSAEVVDHILRSGFAKVELVVLNGAAPAPEPHPAPSLLTTLFGALRHPGRLRHLAFAAYQAWDRRNVDAAVDPLAPVDCSARLGGVESMRVDPVVSGFVHRFPQEAVERIRSKQLDVLIRFGFNILRGDVLRAAKHGVWSYHHGDNDRYHGGPACFWEICERNAETGATLQVLTEDLDAGLVLYKGLFATHEGFSSQARNRVQPFWGSTTFMIQKLRELHAFGWEHVERLAPAPGPYRGRRAIYSRPTNAEMLRWILPLTLSRILRRIRRPMVRHWRLAIRIGARPVPSSSPPDMSGFQWIESPRGRSYADPFVVEAEGRHWVYFEDYNYAQQVGRISCAEIRDGRLDAPRTALESPGHLSYPCVFNDKGTWYMIPEAITTGGVNLFRCTRFPDGWEFVRELASGFAVDTTIWIEGGVYWFFVTFIDPRSGASQLWLYSSTSLESPWVPHPQNPISTDVRYARGGGAIFRHEGKLYRPSQDGRGEYGRSTILNEIVVLDAQQYREVPAVVVEPSLMGTWLAGTHTYSRSGSVELIDGKMRMPAAHVL